MAITLVPGSADWQRTITASRVGAIMGASAYDSPTSIWHQLAGLVERDVSPPSDPQFRGTWMEPYVLAYAWQRRHPDWTRHADETTWTREDMPWAACNTDSHGVDEHGRPVIVEAKTVSWNSPLDQWGQEGTDEIPLTIWWQVQFQMVMSGIERVHVERCGPSVDEHREYVVTYDPTIGAALRQKLADFYTSVLAGIPPEPDDHPATVVTYRRLHPEVDDSEWEVNAEHVRALADANDAVKAADAAQREARSRLMAALGDAKWGTVDGQRVIRRQRSGKGVALKVLNLPDVQDTAA